MHPAFTMLVSANDNRSGQAEIHDRAGDPLYTKGGYHYMTSSQQSPACVVEPGTPEDAGKIVRSSHSVPYPILTKSFCAPYVT